MVGTRGVPARYGGFETAVEEIGRRLVARGHAVTVYCRTTGDDRRRQHLGMRLVHLPAARHKALETLSHTALSSLHLLVRGRYDVALLFNAANAPFIPLIRARRIPVATHVDGLEWRRAKWGGLGRKYYRVAEGLAVRWSDTLIADAQGIADYYRAEFGVPSDLISYGAPILIDVPADRLKPLGLETGSYHLVVARFEPENHVDVAVAGYLRSRARHPLVVVGAAPYSDQYTQRIRDLAERDPRIRLLGAIWDQDQLDQLYAHALTYVHGHSVGGTNPSLLRAMGAGTAVLAFDVGFNREVIGFDEDAFWPDEGALAGLLDAAESDPVECAAFGKRLRVRAETTYNWDDVTLAYERMCRRLFEWRGAQRPGTPSLLRIARR